MAQNPSLLFYRRMLRVLRNKFQGDAFSLAQTRHALRMEILSHKTETDPVVISKLVLDGDLAREWLLSEMMRADLQQDGKYKLRITPHHYHNPQLKPVTHPEYFEISLPEGLINRT
jgi:hypothetical protein